MIQHLLQQRHSLLASSFASLRPPEPIILLSSWPPNCLSPTVTTATWDLSWQNPFRYKHEGGKLPFLVSAPSSSWATIQQGEWWIVCKISWIGLYPVQSLSCVPAQDKESSHTHYPVIRGQGYGIITVRQRRVYPNSKALSCSLFAGSSGSMFWTPSQATAFGHENPLEIHTDTTAHKVAEGIPSCLACKVAVVSPQWNCTATLCAHHYTLSGLLHFASAVPRVFNSFTLLCLVCQ